LSVPDDIPDIVGRILIPVCPYLKYN